jgi:parallel beta-helix repeat protein
MIARRVFAVLAACLLAASIAGCGDDDADPNGPGEATIVRFPEDAATMNAALEAAGPGDTILVSAGDHMIDSAIVFNDTHTGVTLLGRGESEMGMGGAARPTLRFALGPSGTGVTVPSSVLGITIRGLRLAGELRDGVRFSGPGGRIVDCVVDSARFSAVRCTNMETNTIIEGNIFRAPLRFGVEIVGNARPLVTRNTIIDSKDCGIFHSGGEAMVERNLIVESVNWGIYCQFGYTPPTLSCNAYFMNGTDNSTECVPGDGDFNADPLFCDEQTLALAENSPCAAANAGECGQIGAVGVGCGAVDMTLVRFPEDFATMSEALAAVGPGDTIRVGAGNHMIDGAIVFSETHTNVTIMGRSELEIGAAIARPTLRFALPNGAAVTVPPNTFGITIRGLRLAGELRDGVWFAEPGILADCMIDSVSFSAVRCSNTGPTGDLAIVGNILRESGRFGIEIVSNAQPTVTNNTIIGSNDCGIYDGGTMAGRCERNLIVSSTNWGIYCPGVPPPTLSCNAFFDNGADYSEACVPGDGDFNADPLFCNLETFELATTSPCIIGECGRIGAVGAGCEVDTVAARSSP